MSDLSRRDFLKAGGAATAGGLAGCSGDDSEGPESTETETPGDTPTQTPTETETRTPEEPPENYIMHVLSEGGERDSRAVYDNPGEEFRRYNSDSHNF